MFHVKHNFFRISEVCFAFIKKETHFYHHSDTSFGRFCIQFPFFTFIRPSSCLIVLGGIVFSLIVFNNYCCRKEIAEMQEIESENQALKANMDL